ncbi:sulfite dehydrogenase [Caenispirillum salinarum]|uniref:sulfite dehydrogenase n=1 Tax=Caenispirillum salinarum TaxID=859058 RepID=UPI00384A5340
MSMKRDATPVGRTQAPAPEAPVADTGRRNFLRRSAAAVGAVGAAGLVGGKAFPAGAATMAEANPENLPPNVPEWNKYLGYSVDWQPYGLPSEYEKDVVRRSVEWLTATRESSINFTPIQDMHGFVTPNGVCFERHHAGAAIVDPVDFRLMINGLVDKPLVFTLQDLMRMPSVSRFHFLECAANSGMEWRGAQLNGVQFTHGMIHCVQYTGVPLRTVLEEAGVKPNGKWIMAEGGDSAGMNRSIPMEKALDDCMLAWAMNGEMLRPGNGYPLRLVVPGWEGNMWVKWIRRIEVGDKPWFAREETSKYTDLMPNGKARLFTWEMDPKSVIVSPSPEKPVLHKGLNQLRGLAWSGRGKVKRVDVSLDGGRNWQEAQLDQPVLDKCLTMFRMPFEYTGQELLMQSRCIDEHGVVQPTMQALQKVRGVNSVYHNNSIQTWLVNKNGEVENVRLG